MPPTDVQLTHVLPAGSSSGTGTDTEVVVVGCGPVGAATALLLGRAGVRTVVVDRHREVYPAPRAVAADDEVLRLLTAAGLDDAVAAMTPARGARFVSPAGARLLDVELPGTGGVPGLALYRQPDLERSLRQALRRTPGVELRLGTAVVDVREVAGGVRVRLDDGGTVTARYLVACDGARSPVRQALGVRCAGPGSGQSWLVVDVHGTPPAWVAADRVTYVSDPRRAAVAMPTPTGWRLETLLPPGHPAGPVPVDRARELASGRLDGAGAGDDDGADGDGAVERAVVYRFATRTAERWRVGRVLLAGDAAHTMPPFAGQGLAAGLRDAQALAWRLALVVDGAAAPSLLDGYERERRPHLQRMTALTRLVGAMVTAPPAAARVRDVALRAAARTPGLGHRLRSGGIRPVTTVPARLWPRLTGASARGGHLVPPADVRRSAGDVPLDRLLGGRFTLLAVGEDPLDRLAPPAVLVWERLGGQILRLAAGDPSVPVVPPGQVLVVRPDRVVAAVTRPERLTTVVLALAERLGVTAAVPTRAAVPTTP